MLPRRHVVPRPGGGVALPPRVGRPRQYERALVRQQSPDPFIRGPGHLHPVDIVVLCVRRPEPPVVVEGREVDRFGRNVEH